MDHAHDEPDTSGHIAGARCPACGKDTHIAIYDFSDTTLPMRARCGRYVYQAICADNQAGCWSFQDGCGHIAPISDFMATPPASWGELHDHMTSERRHLYRNPVATVDATGHATRFGLGRQRPSEDYRLYPMPPGPAEDEIATEIHNLRMVGREMSRMMARDRVTARARLARKRWNRQKDTRGDHGPDYVPQEGTRR